VKFFEHAGIFVAVVVAIWWPTVLFLEWRKRRKAADRTEIEEWRSLNSARPSAVWREQHPEEPPADKPAP
jgi:hypothetical protein